MIVIPPVSEYNNYFETMGKQMWEVLKQSNEEACLKVERGNKTLMVRCEQKDVDENIVTYILHYRLYMEKLYCFIEEPEPEQSA